MSELEADDLRESHQQALSLIGQARQYEVSGQENEAKDFYLKAAVFLQRAKISWALFFNEKREKLVAELADLDALLADLPIPSTIESTFEQIYSGLNGSMKAIYEEHLKQRQTRELQAIEAIRDWEIRTGYDEKLAKSAEYQRNLRNTLSAIVHIAGGLDDGQKDALLAELSQLPEKYKPMSSGKRTIYIRDW